MTKPEGVGAQLTSENFLLTSPLYVEVEITDFKPPQFMSVWCDGKCHKETTWTRYYDAKLHESHPDEALRSVAYACIICRIGKLTVLYRETGTGKKVLQPRIHIPPTLGNSPLPPPPTEEIITAVMKVGQFPPMSIAAPRKLEDNLGKDASALYRRGLMCRHNGFGLAAVTYMRRVVEDKTNELIEIAAAHAEAHNVDAKTVDVMRSAGKSEEYTAYEEKLKLASAVLPKVILVNGINPLGELYRLVSMGIHGLDERECVEIADEIRDVFEFIFTNLKANVTEREAFVQKVTKWAARRSEASEQKSSESPPQT